MAAIVFTLAEVGTTHLKIDDGTNTLVLSPIQQMSFMRDGANLRVNAPDFKLTVRFDHGDTFNTETEVEDALTAIATLLA